MVVALLTSKACISCAIDNSNSEGAAPPAFLILAKTAADILFLGAMESV